MVMKYILADSVGQGIRETLVNTDDIVVASGATVVSTNLTGITAVGWNNNIVVRGTVVGNTDGIIIASGASGSANVESSVRVHEGGAVVGGLTGVNLSGRDHEVFNAGEISADKTAIAAVVSGRTVMVNDGLVSGRYGFHIESSEKAENFVQVANRGTIVGIDAAYLGGNAADVLTNRGTIDGDVHLGGSGDRFDNRGGVLEGTVTGAGGSDIFLPSAGTEVILGGVGLDTLDFRGGPGGRVSLADDSGTGWAAGDEYESIERIWGSRGGADTLIGNGADNTLAGFGGADILKGYGSADELAGGNGTDTLTGGQGDDRFVFDRPDHDPDIITDFANATGNNDAVRIEAATFGGGLGGGGLALAASRFQSRADNLAQDADDRFVFRTTDATLWFDMDGKGGAASVLVADLQAGAVLSAADILLW